MLKSSRLIPPAAKHHSRKPPSRNLGRRFHWNAANQEVLKLSYANLLASQRVALLERRSLKNIVNYSALYEI